MVAMWGHEHDNVPIQPMDSQSYRVARCNGVCGAAVGHTVRHTNSGGVCYYAGLNQARWGCRDYNVDYEGYTMSIVIFLVVGWIILHRMD